MKSVSISQCEKTLDFAPLSAYPRPLPAYAIVLGDRLLLVCGFEREPQEEAVVLESDLTETIRSLYPSLSMPETARLFARLRQATGLERAASILQGYGLRAHDENFELLEMISSLPLEIQNWLSQKNVSLRELSFLKLAKLEPLGPVLRAVAKSSASKVQGVQILETWAELFAMGRLPPSVDFDRPDLALKTLLTARFPETTGRDNECEGLVKQLPWPAHTQAKWVRQGDQAGIEVRFRLDSVHDLDRQIHGLEHLRRNMADDLWKMN